MSEPVGTLRRNLHLVQGGGHRGQGHVGGLGVEQRIAPADAPAAPKRVAVGIAGVVQQAGRDVLVVIGVGHQHVADVELGMALRPEIALAAGRVFVAAGHRQIMSKPPGDVAGEVRALRPALPQFLGHARLARRGLDADVVHQRRIEPVPQQRGDDRGRGAGVAER